MKTTASRRILLVLAGLLIVGFLGGVALRPLPWLTGSSPNRLERSVEAYDRGDYETAANLAREHLLQGDRDDLEALRLLARSSSRTGLEDSAMTLFERRIGPEGMEAEDLYLYGVGLDRRGRPDLALQAWEKALEEDPEHPEVLAALVFVHSRNRRYDAARQAAERLVQVPGWQAQGELMLGVALAEQGDPAGATEWLSRALRHDPPPPGFESSPARYRLLLARSALQVGRPDEALEPLRAILAEGPSAEASWLLSRADLQRGNLAEASIALRDAGSYRADHPLEAEPSPYIGEARCAECHPQIAREAATSRHARTLYQGKDLLALPLPDGPLPDPDDPTVSHRITQSGDSLLVETEVDGRSFQSVIEAAFGAADRYVTMVSRDDAGSYRALRHSYYHTESGSGWDRSLGDTGRPDRLDNVLGRPIDARDGVVRCLACHTTNVRFGSERIGPESADSGIGCERCHGPGRNHLEAVAAGLEDMAIVNPAHAPINLVTQSCSECHVLDAHSEPEPESRSDPAWIRSQGRTLSWSRCFTETNGAIGCTTCHDPHQPANPSPGHYESVCLSCHSSSLEVSSALPASSMPVTCPVEPARGCVDCHMPEVEVPAMHATLTDHYIRIIEAGPTQ